MPEKKLFPCERIDEDKKEGDQPEGMTSMAPSQIGATQEAARVDLPTKCIRVKHLINVQAHIEYIDFEGRSDGDSVRKIIQQIRPRELVT